MPIFVKDPVADELLGNVLRASGETNKTKAIVNALRHELARLNAVIPLAQRMEALQSTYAKLGTPDPQFDMKAFSDEMSGQ
jgi:antitoxin VapB